MTFTVPKFRNKLVTFAPSEGVQLSNADIERGLQDAVAAGQIPGSWEEWQVNGKHRSYTGANGQKFYVHFCSRQIA